MNVQIKAKRRKKQPHSPAMPTTWDQGAMGHANRLGLVEEAAVSIDATTGKPEPNPNGVKRMRRVDMLERYHRLGIISTRGWNAAEALRDAFEATMKTPGWPDNDRVQSSPKPDQAVEIMVDRISRFHSINRLVPPEDVPIIDACVFHMNAPGSAVINGSRPYRHAGHERGVQHLRSALDRLADAMG